MTQHPLLYLHIEGESEFSIQVWHEYADKWVYKSAFCNESIFVGIKYVKQSIVNDPWQLAVLNECNFVNFSLNSLGWHASQGQVPK